MRILAVTAVLASAMILLPPSADAQSLRLGPGGVEIDPGFGDSEVGRRDAIRIARSRGLADVESVYRQGRRWVVEGVDRRGRDMEVVIHARTGEILDIQRRGY